MSCTYRFINSRYNGYYENPLITNDKDAELFARQLKDMFRADVCYTKLEIGQADKIEDKKVGLTPIDESKCHDSKGSEGKKYDSNKPMVGTILRVFPQALTAVGMCIQFGTRKYPDPNNWKKNKDALIRYNDSLIRHLTKFFFGKEFDEETGLPHLAHVAWNALAILELYLMEHPEVNETLMFPKEIR